MLESFRRAFGRPRRSTEDMWVKVAATYRAEEVEVWREALQAEQIQPSVRETPRRPSPPPAPPSWEVWVRVRDEPHARLILGFSGASVIRLPRSKPEHSKEE
jgi:hypothetical protein